MSQEMIKNLSSNKKIYEFEPQGCVLVRKELQKERIVNNKVYSLIEKQVEHYMPYIQGKMLTVLGVNEAGDYMVLVNVKLLPPLVTNIKQEEIVCYFPIKNQESFLVPINMSHEEESIYIIQAMKNQSHNSEIIELCSKCWINKEKIEKTYELLTKKYK
jgi:hypothetical protein